MSYFQGIGTRNPDTNQGCEASEQAMHGEILCLLITYAINFYDIDGFSKYYIQSIDSLIKNRDTCRTVCAIALQRYTVKLKLTLTLSDTGGTVLTLMLGYGSLYITWQQHHNG